MRNILTLSIMIFLFLNCYDSTEKSEDKTFINWSGNANGEWVSDANGDMVHFEYGSGKMYIGNELISNCIVYGFTVLWNGSHIATIYGVKSIDNKCIAALVGLNMCFLDIYGSSGNYSWQNTSVSPASCP